MAASIGSLGLPIGCILGFALGPLFISIEDDTPEHWDKGKRHTIEMLGFMAVLATLLCLPMLLLYK